ncbi:MAG TPA: hypothetical protein PLM53_07360 [Spirochaetota bacterium]|nr:hypothetical protein [Spirochaetota bacterium]HPC42687.1 hypothetical protein [Spirochaetota bacterium]HQF07844.1 hypothetical protein [Spirochaetota bacterium]HQH96897.1 hypothetical protein [Spirochaetota bacterium]HQJ72748.1 hypothetical protein [Spirochaetota bacterium]
MKPRQLPVSKIIAAGILIVSVAYGIFYFNYFETPTGDYISNIRVPVLEYMKGNFPGENYKFLPFYPLLLSLLTWLNPVKSADPVYQTAIVLNLVLLAPYLFLVFLVYRRFLPEKASLAALLFLGVNIYTLYMTINSELEMALTLLIVLSLYLALGESRISYATAFFAAVTKWDAVFIVPAVMFRDFFFKKKWPTAIVLGACASAGTAAWLLLSFINTRGQTYVGEIAHRGPNIYRFIIDCFLVAGGFLQWTATHAWFHEYTGVKIFLLALIALPGLVTVIGIIWGIILIWRQKRKEFAPIFVFFAGFLLIHMVYQNTKDRYVMPVLWILTLFLFYGISEGMAPWLRGTWSGLSDRSRKSAGAVLAGTAFILYALTFGALARDNTAPHCVFAALFTALMAAVIFRGTGKKAAFNGALLALACGVLINMMVYYGVRAMDHHGLSRVEFKKAALWYRDHAAPGDRMLISETNVPMYYSGFGSDRFILSYFIKGRTIGEIVPELASLKTTYVFVDDFYIRRLPLKDPNAIDRKAWIFKEIRDHGEASGHFRLIQTFHTRGGITSYLYRFVP